jgi:elongation factor G
MGNVEVSKRRNFAIVGHSGDGKTSLGEALLHQAGATPSQGSVDDGSSSLDYTPEEKERHHTLHSSVFSFEHDGHAITLVDTPGDPNFQADGRIALGALDAGLLVVSASDGVKVGSETMWNTCRRGELPVAVFVNGLDRDHADFEAALSSLKAMGAALATVTIPVGAGSDFRGVIDLIHARFVSGDKNAEIPEELAAAAADAREQLVEAVAEGSDELLEKYLDQGELSEAEVEQGLLAGVRSGALVPVFAGSATQSVGVAELLHGICALFPSPLDRPARIAEHLDTGEALEAGPNPDAPFSGLVFKTIIDRYAGTLSVVRVVSGTVRSDQTVMNATRGAKERFGKLMSLRGAEHAECEEAGPGDIVAVAKLKDVHTGDALTAEKKGIRLEALPIPHGVLSYAISAKEKSDEDKLFNALARLVEEDPTLSVERDPSTGEFLLTGMGELHIRVSVERLERGHGVGVTLKTPKVPYRETISRKAEGVEGKLKKQSGGKGMYGVCYLTVEPLPRGSGLEFVDEIVGGAIPRNLIPAVEKGVLESKDAGPLAGYPVVDVRVRCVDGKHHSVDSNEMAFKIAGSLGFKSALEAAHPELLEPIMNVEIVIPEGHVGDVMGDISSRRGRVQTSEVRGGSQVIKASVPMAEMLEYASALTSLTGGKGAFHMEFSHYDQIPAQLREKVIAEAQAQRDAES